MGIFCDGLLCGSDVCSADDGGSLKKAMARRTHLVCDKSREEMREEGCWGQTGLSPEHNSTGGPSSAASSACQRAAVKLPVNIDKNSRPQQWRLLKSRPVGGKRYMRSRHAGNILAII